MKRRHVGILTLLLAALIQTHALAQNVRRAFTVATVAELYLARPADDDLYTTRGYSQEGVGGNTYRYDAAAVFAVDYGYILDGIGGNGTGTGTGRWIATNLNTLRASQYGVLPTGDATVAFTRAVTASMVQGKPLIVDLPVVSLATWTPVTTTANITIIGDTTAPPTITGPGGAIDVFTLTSGHTATATHVKFASFRYVANQGGTDKVATAQPTMTVPNIAALYSLQSAEDDRYYQTRGYSTEGVGANLYRYDAGSSATPDYGFTLDGPGGNGTGTGTGRFIAVDQTRAVITQFGATTTADATTAIQRAITAGCANGVEVFIPGGTYVISNTLTPTAGTLKFKLTGEGRAASVLDVTMGSGANQYKSALNISDSVWTYFADFGLDGDSNSGHGIEGIDPNYGTLAYLPQQIDIHRLSIINFTGQRTITSPVSATMHACGLFFAGGLEIHIDAVNCTLNDVGMYLYDLGQPKVTNCVAASNNYVGIIDQKNEGCRYSGCDLVANTLIGSNVTLLAVDARRASAVFGSAGFITVDSHGCVLTGSKLKNNIHQVIASSDWAPVISECWIRDDVKTGVLSYGPCRIVDNTFYPAYPSPVSHKTFTTNFAADDKLDVAAHGWANGDEVFVRSATTLPAGLSAHTRYYIINQTTNDFELSTTSGGSAVDITSNGSGAHTVAISRREVWYSLQDNRLNWIGSVEGNRFSAGGGGYFYAFVEVDAPSGSYPARGVISNNHFGDPTDLSNTTYYSSGVRLTTAPGNIKIEDNTTYVTTNMTVDTMYRCAAGSFDGGPQLLNNPFQILGGTVTNEVSLPSSGYPYVYAKDGALSYGHRFLTTNSATPSVAGTIFAKTNNSSPTTVTSLTGGLSGQQLTIFVTDANTTFDFTGTILKGNNGVDWVPAAGDHLTGFFDGSNWFLNVSEN